VCISEKDENSPNILDAENMPYGCDYETEVSVVDLSLEREKVPSEWSRRTTSATWAKPPRSQNALSP
jgi:hypothetical protein